VWSFIITADASRRSAALQRPVDILCKAWALLAHQRDFAPDYVSIAPSP
jgi:hypothetical protein